MAMPNASGTPDPIVLTRVQRDVLWREITNALAGNPEFRAFTFGAEEHNREVRERMEMRFRLLDDLGWNPRDERIEFEVTVPRRALCEFLDHEREELAHVVRPGRKAVTAFDRLIAELCNGGR